MAKGNGLVVLSLYSPYHYPTMQMMKMRYKAPACDSLPQNSIEEFIWELHPSGYRLHKQIP